MWQNLLIQAESGELWVDPSIAIQARQATEDWLTALRDMHGNTKIIQRSQGFSDLPSALQLAAKFDRKANDPDSGLQARLGQFIAAGQELSELFHRSIALFQETDEAAARYMEAHPLPI